MRRIFLAISTLLISGLFAGCATTSPLTNAAKIGDINAINELLKGGADVNAENWYGWTSLITAAEEGHTEVVKLLIDKGADVMQKPKKPLKIILPVMAGQL